MNYFWFGDSIKDAVSKPCLHSQLFSNMVLVEKKFPTRYINGLKRYGHQIINDTEIFIGKVKQRIANDGYVFVPGRGELRYIK